MVILVVATVEAPLVAPRAVGPLGRVVSQALVAVEVAVEEKVAAVVARAEAEVVVAARAAEKSLVRLGKAQKGKTRTPKVSRTCSKSLLTPSVLVACKEHSWTEMYHEQMRREGAQCSTLATWTI